MGYDKPPDNLVYLEYTDMEDCQTSNEYYYFLKEYYNHNILDFFGLDAEEFLDLDPTARFSYLQLAKEKMKEESDKMDELEKSLSDFEEKNKKEREGE